MNIDGAMPPINPITIFGLPLAMGGHGGDCRCWMVLGKGRHFSTCPLAPKRDEDSDDA